MREHPLALLENRSVVVWGENYTGQCNIPPDLPGVKDIAASNLGSYAILENGSVVWWGKP